MHRLYDLLERMIGKLNATVKSINNSYPDENGNINLKLGVTSEDLTSVVGDALVKGKISGVTQPMLIITDAKGNIVLSRTFDGDITINGTLTANKVVGAVYQ